MSAARDAVVIGSGIGGLACAAALARMDRRVLVLERHDVPGVHLGVRTPIRGLYLAGQDAATVGVTGAMMGGVLAAAAIEPRVLARLQ